MLEEARSTLDSREEKALESGILVLPVATRPSSHSSLGDSLSWGAEQQFVVPPAGIGALPGLVVATTFNVVHSSRLVVNSTSSTILLLTVDVDPVADSEDVPLQLVLGADALVRLDAPPAQRAPPVGDALVAEATAPAAGAQTCVGL